MPNQCSNFLDHRSFALFTQFHTPIKPYSTTLSPILSFHRNSVIINRRSRRRRTSPRFPPLFSAQSSPDINLIETTEHHDGSLLFRFGDASEAAKNDELVEELKSKAKWESDVVKVLDGDQEREVIVKTIEREDGSGDRRLTEVADGIRNVNIDGDVIERETNVIRESSDSHAESSDRLSDIAQEEEDFSSQSDDKMNNSLDGVENKLDIRECTAQHDEGDSLNPVTTSVLDNSSRGDKSLDCEEALVKDNDDETKDQSISIKLEPTMQDSPLEVTKAKGPNAEDELQEVETEDTSERDTKDVMPSTIMQTSHIEDTDATNQDVEEGLEDTSTLIDVMPPSDPLAGEPILDEPNPLQSVPLKLEPTTQVSNTEDMVTKDQVMEDRLPQVNIDYSGENGIVDVIPVPHILEAEPIVNEEVNQLQSAPGKLMATMQVSEIEVKDSTDQNLDDGSHIEVTDATKQDVEEGLLVMNTGKGYLLDVMPPSNPSEDEPILDQVNQLHSVPVKLEPTMDVSNIGDMDAKDPAVEEESQQVNIDNSSENDIMDVMHVSGILEAEPIINEEVSQLQAAPVKATMQVSDIEVKDTADQNLDDGMLKVTNEDGGESYIKDLMLSSTPSQAQPVDAPESALMFKQDSRDTLLEAEGIEGKASSSELAELSEDRAILFATEAKIKREETSLADYFLYSGAASLEHPSKALTGGDDAYFVAGGKWLGVASGVSQWSLEGTDPGIYAQELMKTCEKIVLNSSSVPISNPVELLCRGVRETHTSGSSTVMIANFDDQVLHVANIGDTGFMIIRHGGIYKKSSPMLHEFNFALQIEERDNPLQLVEEYRIELDEGDVVVTATDGLFDNLYEKEIAMIVSKSLQAGMKPEEIAGVLATSAQEVGRSAFVRSPFADAAQAAGYTGYAGGKPDDVAVIVSVVEKRSNLHVE